MNTTNLFLESYLMHHGIKGMKWGVRRYQNKDGSLTNLGRKRRSGLTGYDIPKGRTDYLARDRARAERKLDTAKTERQRANAQERVNRLAKADTEVYNSRIRNERKNMATYAAITTGAVVVSRIMKSIGNQSMTNLRNSLPHTFG